MTTGTPDILRVIGGNSSGSLFKSDESETYCIGCGSCAFVDPAFTIARNADGCFQARMRKHSDCLTATQVCPFASSNNEDTLAKEQFGYIDNIKHDQYLGYYLSTYVGHVDKDSFRLLGSSGGMTNWLAATMLSDGIVDAVIHVKDGQDAGHMYAYQISHTIDELKSGSKSKYYPIEMSSVLEYVASHEERYLFIGIPCFVKAIRLLSKCNPIIAGRIKYCIGLVCGHLKSDFFATAEAWESGVPRDQIQRVDFRKKIVGKPASDYAIEINTAGEHDNTIKRTAELSTTNWGLGYFKYNACDYCDDVLAETADVTFGDAWLPKYVQDWHGSNIIIVRNPAIQRLFDLHNTELTLFESSPSEIYRSQAGGFRHRRQGLQYRLYAKKKQGKWVPTKRVSPDISTVPKQRQKVFAMRTKLKDESFIGFREALEKNDFSQFKKHMSPYEFKYKLLQLTLKQVLKSFMRYLFPNQVIVLIRKFSHS